MSQNISLEQRIDKLEKQMYSLRCIMLAIMGTFAGYLGIETRMEVQSTEKDEQ